MDEEYTEEFGRIERIINREFINGQLFKTSFVMKVFSTRFSEWTDERKDLNFYGEIPRQFVGQEARYSSRVTRTKDLDRVTADIEVGEIVKVKGGMKDMYRICTSERADPTLPFKITSELLNSINGTVVFPYATPKKQE